MENIQYKSVIESILFTNGDPVSVKKISTLLELPLNWTREILRDLMTEYNVTTSGIHIIEVNDSYQMTTNRDNADWLEKMFKTTKAKGLTTSALEVLSITAYRQPITKSEIDYIRGVKSDKALQSLIDRKLVVEKGRLERIGKPIIYGTSEEFLKAFNFKSLNELPDISQFENFHLFDYVPDEPEEDDEEELILTETEAVQGENHD